MTDLMVTGLTADAAEKVHALYQAVSAHGGGLARRPDEISLDYVRAFLARAQSDGVTRAIWSPDGTIVGEIHADRLLPRQFRHVLTDLTIAVHPDWQGKGLAALLFQALFDACASFTPAVTRIELMARSGNAHAIRLYQRLGFRIEGRFEKRVRLPDGTVEDDIAMARLL